MPRGKGRQVIAGLDVGTTKVCCVLTEWSSSGRLDVVGVGLSPSRGLRKGVVVNLDSTVESIKHAVGEAEAMARTEVASVTTGVGGGHVRGVNSHGAVGVSGKHQEVSQNDIVSSTGGIVVKHDGPVKVREGVFQTFFACRPASAQCGNSEHFNVRLLAVGVV